MVVSCEAINEVIEDGTVKMVTSFDSANTKIVTSRTEQGHTQVPIQSFPFGPTVLT